MKTKQKYNDIQFAVLIAAGLYFLISIINCIINSYNI